MLRRLATSEGGFGLVELLIAMVVMSIGITAIVAGYSSGILAVDRAKAGTTAGALADRQMEVYRQAAFTSASLRRRRSAGARNVGSDGRRTGSAGPTVGPASSRDPNTDDEPDAARMHEHAPEPPGQARVDRGPRGLDGGRGSSSRESSTFDSSTG